jgi:hypothetical protein
MGINNMIQLTDKDQQRLYDEKSYATRGGCQKSNKSSSGKETSFDFVLIDTGGT